MKKFFKSLFHWQTFSEQLETYLEATILKWKKRMNPLANRIGYGIYFYKNITINLNCLNKEILEIAHDSLTLSHINQPAFPSFISVVDGINTRMFTKLPNHVIAQITSLVTKLPGFKELQSISRTYGYKCELRYNQGKVFFGSLQIHFIKMDALPIGFA
ncbi:hypothetical protein [Paenibacillus aceris]|uniref:Uncharacterized protein n=1 Tax=Paenibacillus aceris TaxID=869555 RepID=A0ABS4I0B9_9BACL|nr:hypothetical protein [Paenibacillus aceris]MBP1964363.1 hypothetical protein [Paenibacillus aceris]NHW36681.1 hypothetical protein [Paenibacillus aceris]